MELLKEYGTHSDDESFADPELPEAKRRKPFQLETNSRLHLLNTSQTELPGLPDSEKLKKESNHTSECVPGAYVSKRKHRNSYTANTGDAETFKSPNLDRYLVIDENQDGDKADIVNRVSSRVSWKWPGHSKPVESLDWHPAHPNLLLSSGFDGVCNTWEVSKDAHSYSSLLSSCLPHSGQAVSVAQWISASNVLSGGYDCCVVNTDYVTMKQIAKFTHNGHVTTLKPHPCNQNLFVSGDASKNLYLWDLRSQKTVSKYLGAGGRILDVEFINNGSEIVASCDIVRKNAGSKMLMVWETDSAIIRSHQIYDEPYTCPCLKALPTQNKFLAQSNADYIIIFSANRPYKINKYKRFEGHLVNGYRTQFDISQDGTLLCTGSADSQLYFFHYFSTKLIKKIQVGSSPIIAVTWNPQLSSRMACSLWDGTIAVCE